MKTAYVIRYGAFGDHVHLTNVIRVLEEEGWHITLEHNIKGRQVHIMNPRVNALILNEPGSKEADAFPVPYGRHIFNLEARYDKVVSFQFSLEDTLIEPEKHPRYFWPLKWRREKNAHTCYYDQSMIWAGFTEPRYMGQGGEVWFSRQEHENILRNVEKHQKNFMILYTWRGTMQQKSTYHGVGEVFKRWLEQCPETTIFTTGDPACVEMFHNKPEFQDKRFVHLAGRVPYRQALNLARYVDLVITPETGLGIGAGAFGTPKIMLLTAASIKNIVGNDENDYSLQSPAWCSPCTRAIYNITNCPKVMEDGQNHPLCVFFPEDVVLARIGEVYDAKIKRRWEPRVGPRRTADGTEVWV